jgi:oligopeptide/dipeptide ABC transporter ATP-binding protein
MYAGRIVEMGPTLDILENPAHPYTIALLHSVPRLKSDRKRLYSIGGEPPKLSKLPTGCRFHPRCERAKDICKKEMPPERQIGQNRTSSCWDLDI